jgi:hypothetical protein
MFTGNDLCIRTTDAPPRENARGGAGAALVRPIGVLPSQLDSLAYASGCGARASGCDARPKMSAAERRLSGVCDASDRSLRRL